MKKNTLLSCMISGASLMYAVSASAATDTASKLITMGLSNGGCALSVTDATVNFSDYVFGSDLDQVLPVTNASVQLPLTSIRAEQRVRFGYTVRCDDAQTISAINIGRNATTSGWTGTNQVNYQVLVPDSDAADSGLDAATQWVPHHSVVRSPIPVAAGSSYTNYAQVTVDRSNAAVGTHTATDLMVRVTY